MPKQGLFVWEPQATRLTGRFTLSSKLFLMFTSSQVLLMIPVAGGAHLTDFTPQGGASFLIGGGRLCLSIDHFPLTLLLICALLLLVAVLQIDMSSQQLIASTPVCITVEN